jgi:integrase
MVEVNPLSLIVLEASEQDGENGAELIASVLHSVTSPHTRRNYAKALEDLALLVRERRQPLSRALFLEYKSALIERGMSASTVNVRLSAVRKLIDEARRKGVIGAQEAAELADVPNVAQKGTRLGNWLSREQSRELLTVPDRASLKGKRDYAIVALLLGCALRRAELAALTFEQIQLRENRWVIPDMKGKGGRVRTVPVPRWVKEAVDAWALAATIDAGPIAPLSDESGQGRGEIESLVGVERGANDGRGDWNRALWRARSAPNMRQAVQEGRGRPGADSIPARSCIHRDDGALHRCRAGLERCS